MDEQRLTGGRARTRTISPASCTHAVPFPASFWKITPAPPKMPAPSFFCSADRDLHVLAVLGDVRALTGSCTRPRRRSPSCRGSCPAAAPRTRAARPAQDAVYSVRNNCAPPSTRLRPLMKAARPVPCTVEVSKAKPGDIHATSPPSATIFSPALSVARESAWSYPRSSTSCDPSYSPPWRDERYSLDHTSVL